MLGYLEEFCVVLCSVWCVVMVGSMEHSVNTLVMILPSIITVTTPLREHKRDILILDTLTAHWAGPFFASNRFFYNFIDLKNVASYNFLYNHQHQPY